MPVVPGFKYDLFISYAHQNDRPWGWVSEFIKTLKAELENKSRDFKVWWDPGLRTGEDFNDAIAEAISGSAVFLSVLSPAYGDSSYCKLEMEQFRNLQHRKFGLKVGSMSRMQAIVIDREFTRDKWAPEFRTTSPYEFFNEEESLFAKPSGLAPHDPWIQGLWKVRDSIWPLLQDMRRQIEEGTANDNAYVPLPPPVASKTNQDMRPVVHVAEVTDDLFQRRENLRTALGQARDFQVVAWSEATAPPDSGLGALSVHLFGKFAGRGLSRLQLESTVKAHPSRKPLVWLARDFNLDDAETPEHKLFLESLLSSNEVELLRTDFEDLKEEIGARMRPPAPPPARVVKDPPIIHIWHAIDNPSALAALKRYLTDKDCGIQTYNYSTATPEQMQSRLGICDGLIVPYMPETRTSAEDAMMEAFRLRRREERPRAFAAVELPPTSDTEFNFEHPRVMSVHIGQPPRFDAMDVFLSRLEGASA